MRAAKGITLIEVVIVLAVIAIIGAIIIPNFISTTDKARLKGDVQSARVIGNALGLYNAEQSKSMPAKDMAGIIKELGAKGYIDEAQASIQTEGASWLLDAAGVVVVDISKCGEAIRKEVYNQLNDQEKKHVRGQSGS